MSVEGPSCLTPRITFSTERIDMNHLQSTPRVGISALAVGLRPACAGVGLSLARPTQAALAEGNKQPQLLIGLDDDRRDNSAIQSDAAADPLLSRTDVPDGGPGNDVMFGLNGNDVMDGGPGQDIILGGPDGGPAPGGPPNSDIMFGGPGAARDRPAPGD